MAEMQEIMQTKDQKERLTVKVALWSGIVLTVAAIVRVSLWRPATPQPETINPLLVRALQTRGWSVQTRKPGARDGEELSWATGVVLSNAKRFPKAELNLVPVRARGPSTYTLKTLVQPVLGKNWTQPKQLRFGEHELIRLKHLNQQQIETACIISGVAMSDPNRMLRSKLQQEKLSTLKQQIERLAGLRQTRNWDCLLVVVRQPVNARNKQIWEDLVRALQYEDDQANKVTSPITAR